MRTTHLHAALAIVAAGFLAMASASLSRTDVFREHIETFSPAQMRVYALAALAMLAGYGLFVRTLLRGASLGRRASRVWGAVLLAVCLLTPPFLSRDAAGYALTGKAALSGANPYLAPLASLDPAWASAMGAPWWTAFPTAYGPLFVIFAASAALAPAQGLVGAVLAYKSANLIVFLASIALVARIAARLRLPSWIPAAYAFNPAILLHAVLEGHNDILVTALLLAALALTLEGSRKSGAALLGAAIAAKTYPILLLPLLLGRDGLRANAARFGLAAAAALAAAAPFGFPFASMLAGLRLQASLPCLYACTPAVSAFDRLFGAGADGARAAAAAAALAFVAWRFLAAPKAPDATAPIAYVFWTLAAAFLLQIRWFAPWYVIALLPFALLLSGRKAYLAAALLLTAFSLLQYAQIPTVIAP